ncbi:hypothetical protein ACLKA6_006471 [Drosophila palustris]
MFWPGKLAVALQNFSASVPSQAEPAATENKSCSNSCECKCKCCHGSVQKFVSFDAEATTAGGAVQKMVRLSTSDLLLLLRTAQSRENFWTNQYYKVDLRLDFEALSAAFGVNGKATNLAQLEQIMNTVTSGYRRALARLSGSEAHGALRPMAVAQSWTGLRCSCTDCGMLPWSKLKQLETHQWVHKPSNNWHCCLCYRRYFIQHTLLSHLSRRTKRDEPGELLENVNYKQLMMTQRQQEQMEQQSVQVEQLPKGNRMESELPLKRSSAQSCLRQHHSMTQSSRRWQCASCTRSFSSRRVYLQHLRRVREACQLRLRRFKCSSCKGRFQLEISLKQHVAQAHVRSFRCLICKLPAQSRCCDAHSPEECRAAIRERMEQRRQEQGRPPRPARKSPTAIVCAVCQKEYRNSFLLNIHMKRIHWKQADFICDQCGKAFYSKKEVQEHIKKVHLKTESIYCEPCGLTIKERGNYMRHCDSIRHVEQLTKLAKLQGKLPPDAVIKKHVPKGPIIYCEPCDRHIKEYANYRKHCDTKKHKRKLIEHEKSIKLVDILD